MYGGSLLDSRAAQAAAFGAGLAVPGLGMAAKGIDIAQRVANANAVNAMLGKEPMSFREIVSRGLSPNIAIDSDVSHFQRAATLGNNINVEAALKDYNKGVPMNPGNRPSPGINRGGMNLGNRPGPGMNRGYGGSGGDASGASRGPGSGAGGRGR
ncbi:MAG: hypothetical protein O2782_09495 [bacterium]|nr:hypothetical protein [bacterium]